MKRFLAASLAVALLAALLALTLPAPARADATFTVNNNASDTGDFLPGDGVCETASGNGVCTLRAAVQEANALAGSDTIVLPVAVMTLTGSGDDSAAAGDLDILDSVTINGSSASGTIIVGSGTDRVFHILNNANVNINNVTIRGGFIAGNGGGILLDSGTLNLTSSSIGGGGANTAVNGGGIYQAGGNMTINTTTVTINFANGNGGGVYQAGGSLTINRSTFFQNTATGAGGGLYVPGGVTATVNNSTFSDNDSAGVAVTAGGGAVFAAGTVNLNSVTIAGGNAASNAGGGVMQLGGTVNLRNTLIADNTATVAGPDCSGTVTSLGYNLVESLSGCSGIANGVNNDIAGFDPALNGLGNNGGLTQTHSLQSTSLAIEAGNPAGCGDGGSTFSTDQRGPGFARAQDTNMDGVERCDIGAYELPPTITVTASITFTPSNTPTPTITETPQPSQTPTPTSPSSTPAPSPTFTVTPTFTPVGGGKLPAATVSGAGTGGGGTGGGNGASVTLTVAALQTMANASPTSGAGLSDAGLTATLQAQTAIAQAPTALPSQTPTITPTFSLPAEDVSLSTSRIIGVDGGSVTCGIWIVDVPPAAVPDNSVFQCETISPEAEAEAELPISHRAFWHIVEIKARDAGGTALNRFNPPLKVCGYYDEDFLDSVGGDPTRLLIYTADGPGRRWTSLSATPEEDGVPRVCAEVDRLSLFRLVAQPSPWIGRLTSPLALGIGGGVCCLGVLVVFVLVLVLARRRGPPKTEAAAPA